MKEKIVGICICMLLIATAVPAVTSVKNNAINTAVPSHPLASMAENWTQQAMLLASDGAAYNYFGVQTFVSGDTAIIGASNASGKGAAYVFTRTGTTWTQQAQLNASDGAAGDFFGSGVIISGDTALIGASGKSNSKGAAYVFTRNGTIWTQQQKLTASDGVAGDFFGSSVSLYGDTALIGANGQNSWTGAAYVFTRTGTTWTQQAKLTASDGATGDYFGYFEGCSLNGDTALIGANGKNSDKGAAYVFTRTGTTWTQQAKLTASDGATGDYFGLGVFISGDTALIGARGKYSGKGAAYVFTRTGTTWTQQTKLLASDGVAGDTFGFSVSLSGDTALIGAPGKSNSKGAAYVFTRTGTTWTQQTKLLASDGAAGDIFGNGVSISDDTALIGAPWDADSGTDSGSAYVFTKTTVSLTYSITGGLGVHLKITNNGTTTATLPWSIHVTGGILGIINKTVNGTIDIPAGGTKTVGTGMLFGFGALSITATVAGEEKTAKGTQILIFSMVKT